MKKFISTASSPLAAFLLLLVIWELAVRWKQVPAWILPGPLQVMKTLTVKHSALIFHASRTILEAVLGLVLSIFIAFLLACLLNNITWLKRALYPLLILSQTVPLITLAVLFTIWFGWGIFPKILVVILVCFFPIVINLMKGLDSVASDQVDLFRSMGASQLAIFKMIRLPAAMPDFFSGLRISATYCIMAAVIGEWMGSQQGLGYYMVLQQKNFAIDSVLAAVVVICALSLLLVLLVDLGEYLFIPWNRKN